MRVAVRSGALKPPEKSNVVRKVHKIVSKVPKPSKP
jgi:hypothetical protein